MRDHLGNQGGLSIFGGDHVKLTKYEQETIINFNAGEPDASLYTRDPAIMRKLDRLVDAFPNVYRREEQDDLSKTYSMPKSCVTYRKPRNLTDEQRAEMRERMNKVNKHNK